MAEGRGFSEAELKEVGLSSQARRYGIRIDVRRRTKNEQNIAALKKWFEENSELLKKQSKRKPRQKQAAD